MSGSGRATGAASDAATMTATPRATVPGAAPGMIAWQNSPLATATTERTTAAALRMPASRRAGADVGPPAPVTGAVSAPSVSTMPPR
ncbi:hypothetical protein HFP72_00875 [Nocardiopsis sp. ARC36]